MIPVLNDGLNLDFEFKELPTHTYKLNVVSDNISGFTDELQAMAQAIYLILNIERYDHLIYSWNYGIELSDLFGQPISFVLPEIKRRITEALLQDIRITAVDSFSFESKRGVVHATFTVRTIFGAINAEKEVKV